MHIAPIWMSLAIAGLIAGPSWAANGPARSQMTDAVHAAADAWSAQSKRKKRVRAPQRRIACTRYGCVDVPRGCFAEPERTWDGTPSGFERIVCPRR